MKKTDPEIAIAFAWYKPEQWELLRACSVDRDNLEETFAEWESKAEEGFALYKKQGSYIEKVIIDVDELVAWCKSQNKPIDGSARSELAMTILRDKDK